jgi:Arc/MetJ-type ribon-helix-helix transcriptional regulator
MGGMRKTTVYLPDDLKAELGRVADMTGRSEADLIREGIRLVSERTLPPAPRLGLFDSGVPDLAERVDEHLKGFGER